MCVLCLFENSGNGNGLASTECVFVVDYFKMKEIECYFVFLVFSLKYSDKVAKDA